MDVSIMAICFSYRSCGLFNACTMSKIIKKFAVVAFVIISALPGSAQCPMCKAALTSNRDHLHKNEKPFGNGINKGILFLLSAPYILIGTAGFVYYKTQKKKKLANGR